MVTVFVDDGFGYVLCEGVGIGEGADYSAERKLIRFEYLKRLKGMVGLLMDLRGNLREFKFCTLD